MSKDATLGMTIFFDRSLGADGKTSCASCHDPKHAFAGKAATSSGAYERTGTRNAPSLLALTDDRPIFWDGRRSRLSEGVLDPFFNPVEMGLSGGDELRQRMLASAAIRNGARLSEEDVARALTAYLDSLGAPPTHFERTSAKGRADAALSEARYGEELFNGRAGCAVCHAASALKPVYTDYGFHASGTGLRNVEGHLPELMERLMPSERDPQSVGSLVATEADIAALGRFVVTRLGQDVGRFRTPSLRYVADTAPYMHDGSIPTIEAAVDQEVYWRGLASGRPVTLTVAERGALVAFLKTLGVDTPSCLSTPDVTTR